MLVKRIAAAAACALFFASAVDAHGPTRQRVDVSVEINAPADKVWNVVGNFEDMNWRPDVAETRAENVGTDNAARTLVLENGGTMEEEIRRYDDERMTYTYRVTGVEVDVLPVTNYSATLKVVPGDNGSTIVEWGGAFTRGDPNNDPPEHLNDDAAVAAVTAMYEEGLAGLKEYLENDK